MKNILAIILTVLFVVSAAACDSTAKSDSAAETTAAETTAYTGALPTATEGITIPEVKIEQKSVPSNEGTDLVKKIKIGWCLGNTFDAGSDTNSQSDELNYESSWCGTKTTQEMIDTIKAAGFNALRLPVSWHNHVDADFNISEVWLNRVQEVVDYAYKNDMYVILNIHHDIYSEYYYPTYDCLETSTKYMTAIWKQLSEKFKDYDEKLIFEGINEPRPKGTDVEWYYTPSIEACLEGMDCINKLNQTFVDTVRAAGGNNASRFLMVPAYCASPDAANSDEFVIPTDIKGNENRIIVSIHAYTPYNFALQAPSDKQSRDWFEADNLRSTTEIDRFMDSVYEKFVANGIPVIIGEFGARNKLDNTQSRVDFAAYYTAAAHARGMACFWWDNAAFLGSGENFGLLNRKTCEWQYPDVVLAMMKY